MLNKLHNAAGFKGFYMNHNGPKINHLSFADDTILFCNGSKRSMELVVLETLSTYEDVSGQLINKEKRCFAMADNTDIATINRQVITPWKLDSYIKEIRSLVEVHGFNINHCFREANKPADKLAALSHSYDDSQVFNSLSHLLQQVKGLINMDKWIMELSIFQEQKD